EITGLDLVRVQLDLAAGRTLAELSLDLERVPAPRGMAIQARINMETMSPDGRARPASGALRVFEPPSGPGIRVDTLGYVGYRPSPRFDSLLAKLVVTSRRGGLAEVTAKASRALSELKIIGVPTNAPFLARLLGHPDLSAGRIHTRFVEEHASDLIGPDETADAPAPPAQQVGARVDPDDPLAVLVHGKSAGAPSVALSAEHT